MTEGELVDCNPALHLSGRDTARQVLQPPAAHSHNLFNCSDYLLSYLLYSFPSQSHFPDLLRSGNIQTHKVMSTWEWAQSNTKWHTRDWVWVCSEGTSKLCQQEAHPTVLCGVSVVRLRRRKKSRPSSWIGHSDIVTWAKRGLLPHNSPTQGCSWKTLVREDPSGGFRRYTDHLLCSDKGDSQEVYVNFWTAANDFIG